MEIREDINPESGGLTNVIKTITKFFEHNRLSPALFDHLLVIERRNRKI